MNIWCVGLNYSDHAAEAGMAIPEEPILFNKSSATFCGPLDNILFSDKMTKLDWEVELGIVISKPALNISAEQAFDHIAGFVVVNDVSERAWQLERGGQWAKGSIPARMDLELSDEFNPCQRQNLVDLKAAAAEGTVVRSMAHNMAVPEKFRKAMFTVISEFTVSDMSSQAAAKKMQKQ